MADVNKRLRYFHGQFLQAEDFEAEQAYHLDRLRRHNRELHSFGIARGLAVTAEIGQDQIVVHPGSALDREGRQIVLSEGRTVPLGTSANKTVLVVLAYYESPSDPSTAGDAGETRILESPRVELVPDDDDAPDPDLALRLARIQVDGSGRVARHDHDVRVFSGVQLAPETSVEVLRFERENVDPSLWPALRSGAQGRLDLTGDFNVSGQVGFSGDLTTSGKVDGRDVSADGTKLDGHVADRNNPHATTAQQVGALVSVGGISNAGGDVAIKGGTAITVTPNNADKSLTISASLTALGAPASIAGVSNAGQDIPMVGQNGITVTGDNSTKQIRISTGAPASVGGVSNPGGNIPITGNGGITVGAEGNTISISTSPQAIGALPADAYLRRKRVGTLFTNGNGNGATQTVVLDFRPRVILAQGTLEAKLSSDSYGRGAPFIGQAVVDGSSISQSCVYPEHTYYMVQAPYSTASAFDFGVNNTRIADGVISDHMIINTTNARAVRIWLTITEILDNGFKVKFEYGLGYAGGAFSLPDTFFIDASFLCLG